MSPSIPSVMSATSRPTNSLDAARLAEAEPHSRARRAAETHMAVGKASSAKANTALPWRKTSVCRLCFADAVASGKAQVCHSCPSATPGA